MQSIVSGQRLSPARTAPLTTADNFIYLLYAAYKDDIS